jgi:hypothetical protein
VIAATLLTVALAAQVKDLPPEQWPAIPAGGKWVLAEMTCYCPCNVCTDGDGETANGTKTARVPYALAASRGLPLGARVLVPAGFGLLDAVRAHQRVFTVDDRGGGLDTEAKARGVLRLDMRVKEHWWAKAWGRWRIPVYLLP